MRTIKKIVVFTTVLFSCSIQPNSLSNQDYNTLAESYKNQGKTTEAIAAYKQALLIAPDSFATAFNLANEYFKLGNRDEAIAYYKKALSLNPQSAQAYFNVGLALADKQLLDEAIDNFQQAIHHNTTYHKAHLHLGIAYEKQNKTAEAIKQYEQAIALEPTYVEAHHNLGKILCSCSKFNQSISALKKASELQSKNTAILLDLANTLNMNNQTEEALQTYYSILELSPNNVSILYNTAYTLKKLGRINNALPVYKKVLALDPEHTEAHFSLSLAYLISGDFENGWEEYEWRWKRKGHQTERVLNKPVWDGSDLKEKTILLHAEQGLGDTFQFIRYAKVVKDMGAQRVIVAAQKPLVQLLSRCPYIDEVVTLFDKLPSFDTHAPLLSLPFILKTREHTIPHEFPYLFAQPELITLWKEKLAQDTHFKVGICWQGNTGYTTHFLRTAVAAKSMQLTMFSSLFNVPGVSIYNLQKTTGEDQINQLPATCILHSFAEDFDESHGRFMDTAALIKNLDLVITIDTSIAHLAAGLGVPVWLLLPEPPDWRWMLKRLDTPWYPNMLLFRQPEPGDWESVMATVAQTLEKKIKNQLRSQTISTQISPGELIDRITIARIRNTYTAQEQDMDHLEQLEALRAHMLPHATFDDLTNELLEVNASMWYVKEALQKKAALKTHDEEFINLVRLTYLLKTKRNTIKQKINEYYQTRCSEEEL